MVVNGGGGVLSPMRCGSVYLLYSVRRPLGVVADYVVTRPLDQNRVRQRSQHVFVGHLYLMHLIVVVAVADVG